MNGTPGAAADERLAARRAIEALRSGVPSQAAVRLLGTAQPHVEGRFWQQLQGAGDDAGSGVQTPGLLIAGDFGAGKSHLLGYLQHVALQQGFVCSRVVISKETPLYDPNKLYRAALQSAVVPGKRGVALTEIAATLDFASPAYAELSRWAGGPESGLNSRFPATLFLYERVKDPEILDRIVSLWAGDPLNVSEIRSWLRAHGAATSYPLERVPSKELPFQRFTFASRLMAAAGFAGWVLLVDEVELIGRYSFMPRARSYAALARWAGHLPEQTCPGLITVFAITSDFASAVLEDRNDAEIVPGKLRASGLDPERQLASAAELGMRLIARETVHLSAPDRTTVQQTKEQVRQLHARAYGWEPPALDGQEDLSLRMRQHVRQWINEWDLKRLYSGAHRR
ncbi:MAG: DUF2791 family P-loop domain-containing protein, partial [Chloroflexota bacterium]|nr:DUF2791 family P-loop domain-containing protein [Chloroflexota bacterium]